MLPGGFNPSNEDIIAYSERYRAMTEQWVAANGHASDFSSIRFELSDTLTSYIPKLVQRGDANWLLLNAKNNALWNYDRGEYFLSTDSAINAFIADFDRITGQKRYIINQLTEYYSRDAIVQRAKNAGFADDAELFERIIETQLRYGEEQINRIKSSSPFSVNDDLETALTRFLTDTLSYSGRGWEFNNIPGIFGVERGDTEARQTMAEDFARAALSGGGNIRVGNTVMTYQEFLNMERTMNDAFRRTADILGMGDAVLSNTHLQALQSIQNMVQRWLAGQTNPDIQRTVASWFNDTLDNFFHIKEMREQTWQARSSDFPRWYSPLGQIFRGSDQIRMLSGGFDINELNINRINMMDMLMQ
jgi:hypothetical protein